MAEELEIISHDHITFHVFLVNLLYRTPHIHKDYEICLVLDGEIHLVVGNTDYLLKEGDLFLTNPYECHELKAASPALILSLQVAPGFFTPFFPQMEHLIFQDACITANTLFRKDMLSIADTYFQQEDFYALSCAALISHLFHDLLKCLPYQLLSNKEQQFARSRGKRMRKIIDYVDAHHTEKILLTDIANQENLDLYYLSHFFKDCFGLSFQDYVTKVRCEHARQLLLLSNQSLLDISIACGFSDPKYFNKGFLKLYGMAPREYRRQLKSDILVSQQKSILTTQKFLSPSASLVTLERYR